MTRDLKPTSNDLWRLVEKYGSIAHAADAIGVEREELLAWLRGEKEVPLEYYEALVLLTRD
jgi:hypothetical protein